MANKGSASFKIAVVQATPVFLDRAATVNKACDLIERAGRAGARLIVLPESFIPTYPDWVWAIPAGEEGVLSDLYAEFLNQSVEIPGPATEALCLAARRAGACVAIGVSECNTEASGASLYNTLLYIGPDGQILGKHRKLVPTGGERLIWAQGDGSTLAVHNTAIGRVGGLICWENYMPLARYALYAWGVEFYVAPTWDRGEPWLSTIRHIAKESRAYVLSASIAMRLDDIPDWFTFKSRFYQGADEWINVGDSAIVNPEGHFVAGPVQRAEEILYAEVDPRRMRGSKWMLDVAGHYARPDVFELLVHTTPRPMITLQDGAVDEPVAPAAELRLVE